MSHLILSGLSWAFSFWMVADSLSRRSHPAWVVVILLLQPYGAIAYVAYQAWGKHRRARATAGVSLEVATPAPEPSAPREATLELADHLEEQRRFSEATSLYRRALADDGADPRALHGLARSLFELEQTRQAIDTYEALMSVDPRFRNYSAALEYAEALCCAGRHLDATSLLEGMVAETGRYNHRLALAHYCEAAGQAARAQNVLMEALALYAAAPPPEQEANRRWQRRISARLDARGPARP